MLRKVGPLFAVMALLAPLVLASGLPPPRDAKEFKVGERAARWWFGPSATMANSSVNPSAHDLLWFALMVDRLDPNATSLVAFVNVSSSTLAFANTTDVITKSYGPNSTSEEFHFVDFPFIAPANVDHLEFNYSVEVALWNGTNLSSSDRVNGAGELATLVPAPLVPTPYLIGGGIVLLVAVALGAYGLRQRNVRRRMRGKTRSTTLQQLEQEEKAKKPQQQAQVQQEIRQQEGVRTQRREMQILEAKRADAQKGIELLKKRHELGALSKLQYDNMVAKRQAELARIEQEIQAMDAENS